MPEFNSTRSIENFFKAVILIHQCDSHSELLSAEDAVYRASNTFDVIDFGQLKQMISNHRNRIDRNT